MPTTETTSSYQPAPVKKRRVASLVTAVAAGVAGLSIAANFEPFDQDGSGTYLGDATEHIVDVTPMALGQLEWAGVDYDSSTNQAPANATYSEFTLSNRDIQNRQAVRLINVEASDSDSGDLYGSVWVHIERQDPTGAGGANNVVYHGPLSGLSNRYMGDIVQGATQTFEVLAWTADAMPDEQSYDTTFVVHYVRYDPTLEHEVDGVQP